MVDRGIPTLGALSICKEISVKKFLTNDTGLENVSEKRNDGKNGKKVIPRKVLLLFRKISSVMNCSI